jgi:hypothetical protein
MQTGLLTKHERLSHLNIPRLLANHSRSHTPTPLLHHRKLRMCITCSPRLALPRTQPCHPVGSNPGKQEHFAVPLLAQGAHTLVSDAGLVDLDKLDADINSKHEDASVETHASTRRALAAEPMQQLSTYLQPCSGPQLSAEPSRLPQRARPGAAKSATHWRQHQPTRRGIMSPLHKPGSASRSALIHLI